MAYYVISDTHYWHYNIIAYCNRPFRDAHEMTYSIINNINSVVSPNDVLIHCGDFAFYNGNYGAMEILHSMHNCKNIMLILGNHDIRHRKVLAQFFTILPPLFTIQNYMFNHYPISQIKDETQKAAAKAFVNNGGHYYHGHVHNKDGFVNTSGCTNISVEVINYKPVLLGIV